MSIRGQQDQPVPGVTEANNLNKSIVDKRCSELPLHIAIIDLSTNFHGLQIRMSVYGNKDMETHICCSPRARCAPRIQTSRKTRQIQTDDGSNAAKRHKCRDYKPIYYPKEIQIPRQYDEMMNKWNRTRISPSQSKNL